MWLIAHGIKGKYGDEQACVSSVLHFYKNFTAGRRRAGQPIEPAVVLSTSNVSNSSDPPFVKYS